MSGIYFVRHGQASFGSGNYDQLSALGHRQSVLLGEYFAARGLQFDQLLAGDMQRHRETAEGIARGMPQGLPAAEVRQELNEFDFHSILRAYLAQHPEDALPDKPQVRDFFRRLRKAILLWSDDGLQGDLPEPWSGFEQRMQSIGEEIAGRFAGQRVLVVSSGGAIAMLLRLLLQAPAETMVDLNLQTRNTAITQCVIGGGKLRLVSFNGIPHLEHPQRSELISYA